MSSLEKSRAWKVFNLALETLSNLIVKWKKQLIEQSNEVFAAGKGLAPDRESEIQGLQAKIGQLTMENDFLSKVLGR